MTEITKQVSRTSELRTGQLLCNSTPQPISFKFDMSRGLTLRAHPDNNAHIYLGGPNVSASTGWVLRPDEQVTWPIDDASKVYAIAEPWPGVCDADIAALLYWMGI